MVSDRCVACVFAVLTAYGAAVAEEGRVMSSADVMAMPRPKADHVIAYAEGPHRFGELRLPQSEGPHPVVVVIHGGCWLAEYDLGYMSAFAEALTSAGLATWSIEYRRIGNEGGGWPGTLQDVAIGTDHLRGLARVHDLDLERVVAVGHSAGGHLALWLAGRRRLDAGDPLRGDVPLALKGVVALAGITDLAAYASPEGCGSAVAGLLGGDPREVGERVNRSSPIAMLPFGISQTLVIGERDSVVPPTQASSYREVARKEGDKVTVLEIPGAGHFELVDPAHNGFQAILRKIEEVLATDRGN